MPAFLKRLSWHFVAGSGSYEILGGHCSLNKGWQKLLIAHAFDAMIGRLKTGKADP
jgi:hypothetical protein